MIFFSFFLIVCYENVIVNIVLLLHAKAKMQGAQGNDMKDARQDWHAKEKFDAMSMED